MQYMGKIYTIREACDILQIDATTLRRWDREGKIHCIRLSNNFRRVPEGKYRKVSTPKAKQWYCQIKIK